MFEAKCEVFEILLVAVYFDGLCKLCIGIDKNYDQNQVFFYRLLAAFVLC